MEGIYYGRVELCGWIWGSYHVYFSVFIFLGGDPLLNPVDYHLFFYNSVFSVYM